HYHDPTSTHNYPHSLHDALPIFRQSGGRTLFAAYDEPDAPASTTAVANRGIVTVNWDDRSNNESLFTVERSTSPTSGFSAVANVDRKSTRLNSSHVAISYAVFCL